MDNVWLRFLLPESLERLKSRSLILFAIVVFGQILIYVLAYLIPQSWAASLDQFSVFSRLKKMLELDFPHFAFSTTISNANRVWLIEFQMTVLTVILCISTILIVLRIAVDDEGALKAASTESVICKPVLSGLTLLVFILSMRWFDFEKSLILGNYLSSTGPNDLAILFFCSK